MVGYGFGFGFPEFAEDNCLPTFPFETFGWVGVLGFHWCFAMCLAYVLVVWCGPMGVYQLWLVVVLGFGVSRV